MAFEINKDNTPAQNSENGNGGKVETPTPPVESMLLK